MGKTPDSCYNQHMKNKLFLLICILLLPAIAITGCGGAVAKDGDNVSVHYTGTLADGTVFDSSRERAPLQFTVGAGQMISGFDKAVKGMKVGEIKTVTLPPEEAYGAYREDQVITVNKDELPADITIELGGQLEIHPQSGGTILVTITDVTENTVTLDANHHLAGKELTFEIELISIN